MTKDFWKSWKRKTKLEIAAINSLKQAERIILKNIPKSKIVAIYAGGSFIRREMNEKSDVDTWTIVNDNNFLERLEELSKNYRFAYKPAISLSALSIWELKNGKRYLRPTKPRASPSRFTKKINDYELIYGKPLNPNEFPVRTDKEDLKNLIQAFHKHFFPLYKQKKFGFSEILNQVFWLVDLEQRIEGKEPPYSWKKLEKSIKNKKHIVHEALKLRLKKTKDKKEKDRFIISLKMYLNKLEKKLK